MLTALLSHDKENYPKPFVVP